MARDDYFLMVYRILSYLYKCIRQCEKPSEEYLKPLSKDFPIEYGYWTYILENIVYEGYVENIAIVPIDGADPIVKILDGVRITPKGIEYLQENSTMKKAAKYIKEAVTIFKP